MLIVFSGLPGVGKTTLSKALTEKLKAVYLRLDTVEQAILSSSLEINCTKDAGYLTLYGLAKDNLNNGLTVVADCVNPITATRDAWKAVASDCNFKIFEIEVICSDRAEHKRRVELRKPDIKNHELPTWDDVVNRQYDSWPSECLTIDTAQNSIEDCLDKIMSKLSQ